MTNFLPGDIKTAVMAYFRFERQCPLVATEVGGFNADVMVVNGKDELIEIEVKIRMNDFKRDFKKRKHFVYGNYGGTGKYVPNRFCFAVPEEIETKALEYLKHVGLTQPHVNKYGLLVIRNVVTCVNAKPAQVLHSYHTVKPQVRRAMIQRVTSELLTLRAKVRDFKEHELYLIQQVQALREQILKLDPDAKFPHITTEIKEKAQNILAGKLDINDAWKKELDEEEENGHENRD